MLPQTVDPRSSPKSAFWPNRQSAVSGTDRSWVSTLDETNGIRPVGRKVLTSSFEATGGRGNTSCSSGRTGLRALWSKDQGNVLEGFFREAH